MGRKRQKPKGKKINPTLFVFCEGDTEEAYINHLKREYRIPSIHIHPKIGGIKITKRYIDKYKQDRPTHEKDKDFLLYDLDAPKILERLSRINAIMLVSNPCLELWFLLHYKNQTANVDNQYCCKELKNRNREYKKGVINTKLKWKLLNNYNKAIERAKKLKKFKNPSSTVYKIIEILDELKRKKL